MWKLKPSQVKNESPGRANPEVVSINKLLPSFSAWYFVIALLRVRALTDARENMLLSHRVRVFMHIYYF